MVWSGERYGDMCVVVISGSCLSDQTAESLEVNTWARGNPCWKKRRDAHKDSSGEVKAAPYIKEESMK